jgi:hypothetical protein
MRAEYVFDYVSKSSSESCCASPTATADAVDAGPVTAIGETTDGLIAIPAATIEATALVFAITCGTSGFAVAEAETAVAGTADLPTGSNPRSFCSDVGGNSTNAPDASHAKSDTLRERCVLSGKLPAAADADAITLAVLAVAVVDNSALIAWLPRRMLEEECNVNGSEVRGASMTPLCHKLKNS